MIGHWNPVRILLVWGVRGYQTFISPGLPGRCRYYPSCSQYAIDAITEYGVLRGFVLASWRVLRCNPLSHGGYDPVQRQTLFAPRHKKARLPGDLPGETLGEPLCDECSDRHPRLGRGPWGKNDPGDSPGRGGDGAAMSAERTAKNGAKLTAGRTA